MKILKSFIFVLLFSSLANATCLVELSFIKGSNDPEQSEKIDSAILDQLKNLPFSSFVFLKKEEKKVQFGELASFIHANEHGEKKVVITPIRPEGDKVQALIEWTSASGENILSSKISLINGSNMVFGAEHGNTRCTVINVLIKCDK